ncbi:MAG: carbon-nitrogen hydrolase family protein [Leptonema sp. (in: bacteria)]
MPILKVTIFQKNLNEGLNLNLIKKLSSLDSDFLVFPEYFLVDLSVKTYDDLKNRSKPAIEWLTKLSNSYKGIIIGGSLIKEDQGKFYNSCPVVYKGDVIDWYSKRELTEEESKYLTPGLESGIFILNGIRFGVLICNDVNNHQLLKELHENSVSLIFVIVASLKKEETIETKYKRDEELFLNPAKKYHQTIIKCSSVGNIFKKPLQGRSLLATPLGIPWRVSPEEEDKEILKTLVISI